MIKVIRSAEDKYVYGLVSYACCDCSVGDADNCGFGE